MDVTFVGGGDSGLLTALSLRQRHPEMTIRVVDDFDQNLPEVGKAPFKAIIGILHDFRDIDRRRLIKEVNLVFKHSVYFSEWCDKPPFRYPFDLWEVVPTPRPRRTANCCTTSMTLSIKTPSGARPGKKSSTSGSRRFTGPTTTWTGTNTTPTSSIRARLTDSCGRSTRNVTSRWSTIVSGLSKAMAAPSQRSGGGGHLHR